MTTPSPKNKKSGTYVWIIGLAVGLGWGATHYLDSSGKQTASTEAQAQYDQATNARAQLLQQQLAQLAARPTSTIDDFVANMLAERPIVEEAKGLVRLQIASMARKKNARPAGSNDAMIFDYAQRLFEKDQQLLDLMGKEVDCGLALQSIPQKDRAAYYKSNVVPIAERAQEVQKEWAAIANEGKAKGIRWSDAVNKFSE